MGRNLDDVIAALPEERRGAVEARFQRLKDEVESLGELRRLAGRAQAEIASALQIKQPSVSKIEKQADLYLSTLRSYVEAIGGQLDLIVRLPAHAPVRLERLGDVTAAKARAGRSAKAAGRRPRAKTEPEDRA
ncbi:putative XRE-type DNA-binding protein [Methylobacterium sp. BE186]|uniref:XRE family transcriptional regulator n=1 Tax=Methylobacterium sp. BE186 TaxID=2817715 RepID=UPI002864123D|nr:XRE family transcriptional regulator [Methylobacterium sp. BE186]MDR7035486.1 putative XRE-type DNA-binding protein [Methylobacterium sp. BE186]